MSEPPIQRALALMPIAQGDERQDAKQLDLLQQLPNAWRALVKAHWPTESRARLTQFLANRWASGVTVFPPREKLFEAYNLTAPETVAVVVLGQDPYPSFGQAHGLAFSVPEQQPIPKSLKNIYQELQTDVGITPPQHGHLRPWATQGVLLINTVLTVDAGRPASHKNLGWEDFTAAVLKALGTLEQPIIYLLWGAHAQSYRSLIGAPPSHILTAPHPSPLSAYRGFFGCGHFSKTNALRAEWGLTPIEWQI